MSDDEDETKLSVDPATDGGLSADHSKYTHEQKIVSAVWVHEKEFNNQTWTDIHRNFRVRFNGATPPNRSTFLHWERKLFSVGNVDDREKCGRPLSRLMHVPYVRASLIESPDLSLRERSKILGLPRTTLFKIIKEDLNMEFAVPDDGDVSLPGKKRHSPMNGGTWTAKKTRDDEEEDDTLLALNNDSPPNNNF